MLNANTRPSERATILQVIDPDATSAGTVATTWIDMSEFERLLAVLMVGTMGSGGTVDAKLEQATDAAGADVKDVTGKAVTQLTEAGEDDDKQALINLNADEMDIANGFTHVRLSVTVAGAACDIAAAVIGFDAREQPHAHAATVAEVI